MKIRRMMKAGLVLSFVGLGVALSACGSTAQPCYKPADSAEYDRASTLRPEAQVGDMPAPMPEAKPAEASDPHGALSSVESLRPPSIDPEREPEPDGFLAARRLATTQDLRTRAPALLARPEGSEQKELPLEAMRIATVLMSTRARTLVDCTFENPYPRQLEGTFMVRLPDGASPCSLGMFQGAPQVSESALIAGPRNPLLPPLLEDPALLLEKRVPVASRWNADSATVSWGTLRPAEIVEEQQGQMVYEKITRRRIDPALMEWSGGNTFRTRIFPIPPRSRKRVFFVYDQTPVDVGTRTAVALPVPAKLPKAFRAEAAADPRAYRDAALVSGKGETPLPGAGDGAYLKTSFVPTGEPGEGSFLLAATPVVPTLRAGYGSTAGIEGSQVHARILPRARGDANAGTKTAVFVLDTSLSQKGKLAASAGKLLRAILEKDATIERFRVVTFDVTAHDLFAGTRENTPEERERTLSQVESLWLEGATSLEAAFRHLDRTIPEAEAPTCFLLSDAQITWGIEDPRELERAFPRIFRARWICYRMGDSAANRPFMARLSRSRGRVVNVLGEQDLASAALAHRFAPTALESVRVTGAPCSDLVLAGSPRAIFPGQTLEIAFRVPKGTDPRTASIVIDTDSGSQSFSLAQAIPDPVAGRAWAELTASSLLEHGTKDADRVALALSQRFGIANRVASFLILETDQDVKDERLGTEDLDLAHLAELAKARDAQRPVGGPDISSLDRDALAFLSWLGAHPGRPWAVTVAPAHRSKASLSRPEWGERLDPTKVREEAVRREEEGRDEEALRILSSIVEESPRDARMLRLAGFTLMSWSRFADAAGLFARARTLRPFEAQAFLCEALALEAQGKTAQAALRYELVLAGQGTFDPRHEHFARESARRLYARLLSQQGGAAKDRLAALGLSSLLPLPAHEVHLLWNLDECDVDLHVRESGFLGREVSYQNMTSSSGGKLLWDNTVGLGPEIYTHPTKEPAEVFVHYFGTTANEGTVPSATLVVYLRNGQVDVRSAVLTETKDRIVLWERASSE